MFNYNEIEVLEKTLLTGLSKESFTIINTECFGIKEGINYLSIELKANKKQLQFFVAINVNVNKKTLLAYICKHKNKTLFETQRTKVLYDFFKLPY